ncbi:MAG: hypothetical protein IKM87_07850 [Clostridia bacterium]|nr:hypothetical protein [Clostridia bacterium]
MNKIGSEIMIDRASREPSSAYVVYAKGMPDAIENARLLCKKIFCMDHTAKDGCINCRKFDDGNMLDFLEIGGEDIIKIGEVRTIHEFLINSSFSRGARCIHIKGANKLTVQSQNYLLKTLEEPPKDVVFVLSTDNKQALLETVRSRCIEIEISQIPRAKLQEILREHGCDEEKSRVISGLAHGSKAMAMEMMEDQGLFQIREDAAAFLSELTSRKRSFVEMQKMMQKNQERLIDMLYHLGSMCMDAVIYSEKNKDSIINADMEELINSISLGFTTAYLNRIISIINERIELKSRNPQLRNDLFIESIIFDLMEVKA